MSAEQFDLTARDSERRRRRVAWAAAFVAPVIIAVVALLLLQQVSASNRLEAAERQSQDRRATLLSVLSAHQDIETGQRGYVITGEEEFLEPYDSGSADLARAFSQLSAAFASDPEQIRELQEIEALSRQKREFAAATIELRRSGREAVARQLIIDGQGMRLMDQIRRHLGRMIDREIDNIERATRQSAQAAAGLRYLMFGLLAVLLAMLTAAAVAIGRMMDERHKAMVALEDTSRRRAAILDSAMDAIIILNPSGTIESVNAAAISMFGYREDEMLQRDAAMLFADAPVIGGVAEALRGMELQQGRPGALHELSGRRRNGDEFPTDVAVTVAPLAGGLRYVAVIRDITERKRIDQLKAEFVSTVSHELRTPLTSIAGSLGLLAGGAAGELSERAARLITIAHTNADRLVRLINDILDIEKLESGKMRFENERVELAPCLAQILEETRGFAETYGVSLKLDPGAFPAFVHADPDRLSQVVTNLLSNAIKFSPAGGTVTVIVAPGRRRHRITVQDQGQGIPEEFRARIFGKFAQADASDNRAKGGTGLGLSIVKEIVTRLGGRVSFDSHESEGTQFHVQLPALDIGTDTLVSAERSLLLCTRDHLEEMQEALAQSDYHVVVAETAEQAGELLEGTAFDAILLDMGLPGGAVGTIRRARRTIYNENTPILAIAGEMDVGELDSDPALVMDWLHKPVELDSIASRIEAAILKSSGDRPRVLHVDDDPDILRVVATALADKATVTPATSLAEARAALAAGSFDLAILDLTLRDGRGSELLESLYDAKGPIPIVIFSAEDADGANIGRFEAFLTKARTPIQRLIDIVEREARAGEGRP